MTFGEEIRKCRLDKGLTLRDLAKKLKVSHVFIGEVERGVKDISRKHWPRLAKELGATIEEMEKWDEVNWCYSCEQRIPISRRS